MASTTAQARFLRVVLGLVGASGLVYPLILAAVGLALAQLRSVDVVAVVVWSAVAVACSVALVAALRWGASRPVLSRWLLAGPVLPAALELWLFWPRLAG